MVAAFACPECGAELELTGATAGREVQCAFCETWVEVPYLPRAGGYRRKRFDSRALWKNRAYLAVAILGVGVCLVLLGILLIRSRTRTEHENEMATLEKSVDQAEAQGRLEVAVFESEAALSRIRSVEGPESPRIADWKRRRDDLAHREVSNRLDSLGALPPASAVGTCLTLQDRARLDPTLSRLTDRIQNALDESRLRLAEAELGRGRQLLGSGRAAEAFEVGEAVARQVDLLPRAPRAGIRERAELLLRDVVRAYGAVPLSLHGQYTLGAVERYRGLLTPISEDALRRRGYFPPPARTTWRSLWDELAPFRVELVIRETQTGLYLQSHSRVSLIEAQLSLRHSGRELWSGQITARTQEPLPNLPAYLGSRLAVSDRRDPEVERRLYEDAFQQVRDQFGMKLRGIPAFPR